MNILVAMNAFKGTMSSIEVNQTLKSYLEPQNHHVVSIPMSDGGDGFLDSISSVIKGEFIEVDTFDPLGKSIKASYYLAKDEAYIELAKISGLSLIKEEDRNPLKASTYGLGIVIKQAIDQGIRRIYIGIGGSATNDGGAGMLQALGVRFFHKGQLINEMINGETVGLITSFDTNDLENLISDIEVEVISDVKNQLLGVHGASYVYASQKGASDKDILELERNILWFADVVESHFAISYRNVSGSGAAGGIGFGLLTFLQAHMNLGISYMIEKLKVEGQIKDSDLVIVGEGKLDKQTLYGKAPYGIATIAKKYHKKVIGIFAQMDKDVQIDVLDEVYVVVPYFSKLVNSMNNPIGCLNKLLHNIHFD